MSYSPEKLPNGEVTLTIDELYLVLSGQGIPLSGNVEIVGGVPYAQVLHIDQTSFSSVSVLAANQVRGQTNSEGAAESFAPCLVYASRRRRDLRFFGADNVAALSASQRRAMGIAPQQVVGQDVSDLTPSMTVATTSASAPNFAALRAGQNSTTNAHITFVPIASTRVVWEEYVYEMRHDHANLEHLQRASTVAHGQGDDSPWGQSQLTPRPSRRRKALDEGDDTTLISSPERDDSLFEFELTLLELNIAA